MATKKSPVRKTATKKKTAKKAPAKKTATKKWSAKVTATSDAMDLQKDIFKSDDPKKIAASLKRSAEKSTRKKTTPFQSAMSMITFYENRGGKNISEKQKKILDDAKEELRLLYNKE